MSLRVLALCSVIDHHRQSAQQVITVKPGWRNRKLGQGFFDEGITFVERWENERRFDNVAHNFYHGFGRRCSRVADGRRRWQHCNLFGLAQTELHAQSQQGDHGHCDEKTTDEKADSHDPL